MLDQVGEELAAPADAAFEEGEVEIGEAPRHAAQEKPLGDGMAGGGEMADMVEGEVAGRVAQAEAAAAGMEGGRHAEFAAFLPDGVVVVIAVDAEVFVGRGETAERGIEILGHRHPARDAAAEHADLGAELLGHEVEFGDGFVRREHRDHRRRCQPVAELGEVFRGDDIEAADHGAPGLVVGDARDGKTGRRIDDAEIDAELVEPVVEHARHHRRGAVARVGRLATPIAFHGHATLLAFGNRQAECVGDAPLGGDETIGRLVARHLAHTLGEDRVVLDPMAVAVDDGMLYAGTNFCGAAMRTHAGLQGRFSPSDPER